jgi:hypothetical protein
MARIPGSQLADDNQGQLFGQALVIAPNITGNNSNVAWELGFAYALEKPTLIIRQKDDVEQVPFDIYDQRRLEYGSLELAFDECKTLLQYVIDELLSDPPGEIRGHLHNR